jgi:DNA-binding protein HU-beta
MATRSTTGKRRMTQAEVVRHFADKTGMKPADVKELFNKLNVLAAAEVEASGEFVVPGFGKLVKAERRARQGRNPATGQVVQIPARTALRFRVSKVLKAAALPGESTKTEIP